MFAVMGVSCLVGVLLMVWDRARRA
jgi:hypothetical protein